MTPTALALIAAILVWPQAADRAQGALRRVWAPLRIRLLRLGVLRPRPPRDGVAFPELGAWTAGAVGPVSGAVWGPRWRLQHGDHAGGHAAAQLHAAGGGRGRLVAVGLDQFAPLRRVAQTGGAGRNERRRHRGAPVGLEKRPGRALVRVVRAP